MNRLAVCLLLAAASLGAQGDRRLAAKIDSTLSALHSRGFSGIVRVDIGGAPIFEKAYGMANREEKIPLSANSVVQIGSNTKDFTAVAILQLKERGKLSLDDSLGRFFPNVPTDKRGIRVRQVLNHYAGFPNNLGADFEVLSREQFLERAWQRPLIAAPGTTEQYSNTGFAVLAAIIEKVSGQTYDEFVKTNILDVVGLKSTGFLLPNFDPRRVAHGYRDGQDMGTMLLRPHAADGHYWNLRGNGGMLSTVGDMHEFYRALFETEKLLKAETRNTRFDPTEPIGLAGSDGIAEFMYARLPGRHMELIISTNDAAFGLREVRSALSGVLGIRDPNAP